MQLTDTIRQAWGWSGIKPVSVVGDNEFGNLIVKDEGGQYWRLCPEELSCKVVALSRNELDTLSRDQDFLRDWYMLKLVEKARDLLGPLRPGYKYCLKIPAVLGGRYEAENFACISLTELVSASGHIAEQFEGVPDGAEIRLTTTD